MIVYFFIALIATLLGASTGMGGGVIIKPLMDLLGDYDITAISIFSSATVLSMAVVATIKQAAKGFKITGTIVSTTLGAVFGGVFGSVLFSFLTKNLNPNNITAIQSLALVFLLAICLVYEKIPHMNIRSMLVQGMIGAVLGLFSSFLGIGGGPINVAVLCIFFSLELRRATIASVFIIIFSQAASLITKAAGGVFVSVEDFSVLLYMIPAAVIGAVVGSRLNLSLPEKGIKILYKFSVSLVIAYAIDDGRFFICHYG